VTLILANFRDGGRDLGPPSACHDRGMQALASRLDRPDLASLSAILDSDPIQNAYLRSELRLGGLDGSVWWGAFPQGRLRGVVLGGPLVVPWIPEPDDAAVLAGTLREYPPRMVVGPRHHVAALHHGGHTLPAPRQVRDPQPLLVLERSAFTGRPGAPVRRGTLQDLDVLTVAAAAMHREEMGVDPLEIDPVAWRNRMATLIGRGWSWSWMERGEVLFKAELSAWNPDVVQIQGVYTHPRRRRQGIATAGMAALCGQLLDAIPACSLYVNAYNAGAMALYARLGFRRWADFATFLH